MALSMAWEVCEDGQEEDARELIEAVDEEERDNHVWNARGFGFRDVPYKLPIDLYCINGDGGCNGQQDGGSHDMSMSLVVT